MLLQRIFVIIIPLALLFSSCSGRHSAAMLNDIETYIQDRPDCALSAIRAIDTTTLNTRGLRAHYALLHAIALDKNWIDTTDVDVIMPAVEYYERHPSGISRAKAWYYLGRIQENAGDFTSANISFLKAEKWAEGHGDERFNSLIYQSISNTYNKAYLYEEALKYSILSFEISSALDDTLGMNASRYRIAQDLHNQKHLSEADSLYRLLLDGKAGAVSPQLYPDILADYALLLLLLYEDYDSAVASFEKALKEAGFLRTRNYWGAYAYALLRVGKQAKAEAIFKQLETADNDNALTYKTWRSRADAFLGNYAAAYDNLALASEIQTANVAKILMQSILKAQKSYHAEVANAEEQRRIRRNILIVAILALFLAFLTGIIVYLRKKNLRILSEREAVLESYHAISTDLDARNREHAMIQAKYVDLYKNHFGHLSQLRYILQLSNPDKKEKTQDYLYSELKRNLGDFSHSEEIQEIFENVLNNSLDNIMIHFRSAFPEMNSVHQRVVCYLFAGMDATVISTIIPNFSRSNVYTVKKRVKELIRESNCEHSALFLKHLS